MKWLFTDTGFNSGSFNMEYDLYLANSLEPDEAILRFYRWEPYCISLGANQSTNSLKKEKLNADGIDTVSRPTGGRAILHAEELTYSVVYPAKELSSLKSLYRDINLALTEGLSIFNERLVDLNLEHVEPDFPSYYKTEKSAVCFAISTKNEINFNGKKLVGSAQRKMGNVILQHGSILYGDYHKKIVDYLLLSDKSIGNIRDEINETTTDLQEILLGPVNVTYLKNSLKKGFENYFNIQLKNYTTKLELISANSL